jgi:CheY-like chemotaxis protein
MADEANRLLVVEDHAAEAHVISFVLQQAGFGVTLARSGPAAWELLCEREFDLVVSDFKMPGMTGGELCERIRGDERLKRLPIVFLTAKGLELDRDRYLAELSVDAIISKPFSPRELVRKVRECLAMSTAGG